MTPQHEAQDTGAPSRRSKITPEREQEFYDAVLDLIREGGYDALTMEGVAARTRCGKSTLYRQWKSKPLLVAAALRANRCVRFADIDTGSVVGDLRGAAEAGAERAGGDTLLVHALGHAVLHDEDLKQALRDALIEPEIEGIDAMLRRAVERGEIPAGHPALEFVAPQLLGVLRVRPVIEGRHADAEYLKRFVDVAILPALGLTVAGVPAGGGGETGRPARASDVD